MCRGAPVRRGNARGEGSRRAGAASRVVLIKLPQSETAPQHTIVIEELSAWL